MLASAIVADDPGQARVHWREARDIYDRLNHRVAPGAR
jgi:hypothetical protein